MQQSSSPSDFSLSLKSYASFTSGVIIASTVLAAFTGCGSKAPAPQEASQVPAQPAGQVATPAATPAGEPKLEEGGGKTASARKWLGDIPYDVWFDDPLAIAANSQSIGAANPAPAMANNTAAPAVTPAAPAAESPTAAAGGSVDWKQTISSDELQDEMKRIRNRLTQQLQSAGTYSGNYKDIQADGAVIAALGAIVERHPDDLSWKANAKFVRELGGQLRESSKALGKEGFDKTTAVFEKLTSVLSGSVPPDVGNAEEKKTFAESASRAGVMVRMQKAFDWLKSNITTEGKLKSEQETVQHETIVLLALSVVAADSTYDSGEEDDYKKHAQNMINASRDAASAAKEMDFGKFQQALDKVNKTCSDCHNDYRFADS
ncbi:Cytochrome C' [Planctopirus ephydatiae]|uniref:Cytochrome C n=1 Tax=Planctopirus ephydatiae TaxID=2528019 RepID=A0A518GSN2_9PLAN|nr:cytochrome c [Planctopirus ephydatiae]QDV31597.1 Cytochrome C' [Planctopirus ephydatiae]